MATTIRDLTESVRRGPVRSACQRRRDWGMWVIVQWSVAAVTGRATIG